MNTDLDNTLRSDIIIGNRVELEDGLCGEIMDVSEGREIDSLISVKIDKFFLVDNMISEIEVYQKELKNVFTTNKNKHLFVKEGFFSKLRNLLFIRTPFPHTKR